MNAQTQKKLNKKGFTLLELIIVIIIIGVLAALALPRFFISIAASRKAEAYQNLGIIRQSMERCYALKGDTWTTCADFTVLDIDDPSSLAGAHFTYTFPAVAGTEDYNILATRNAIDKDAGETKTIKYVVEGGGVTIVADPFFQ